MSLFQIGIGATVPPSVQTVGSSFMPLIVGLLVFLGGLGIAIAILFYIRHKSRIKSSTFDRVTMLVSLPKITSEDEKGGSARKDQVDEKIAAAEAFFAAIGGLRAEKGFLKWLLGRSDEFSFEIVAQFGLIKFYMSVPRQHVDYVEQQIAAVYPNAQIEHVPDYNIFSPSGTILSSYLVFRREDAFPIKSYKKLDKDPLNALTNAIAKIPDNEGAAFQFIVRSATKKWRRRGVSIARNMKQGMTIDEAVRGKRKGEGGIRDYIGGSDKEKNDIQKEHRLSPQEEEVMKGLEEKASKAGMDVCIRLVVSAEHAQDAQNTLQNMLNAFSQYNIYEYGNSFQKAVPASKKKPVQQFIYRGFNERYKAVLNTEEIASLWHLPTPWTETPGIHWLGARSAAAPATIPTSEAEGGQVKLGFNDYRGVKTPIWIKQPDRQRHMYVIGKSGSGKSQLIASMAIQDIKAGRGIAVVDPHGDLVDQILGNVPKDRVDDVIYFNPSDLDRPMGLNMLEAKDESMQDFAAQEMISIFYKLFPPEMIGPMFEHHMRNTMLALMADSENPGTIAEIPRMFTDEEFGESIFSKVTDPVVRSYWYNEMAKTSDYHKSEMLGYLISKVGRFVENEMMRNIIGQNKSSFDFREVMDQEKILLVNLSKGKTGDVNANLLGLIIVSKLQMAALGRADMPEEERKDFYLYIDEFQNFITDSIATILSEARKYRLNLIIAHQYIGQLVKDGDTKIKDAVFGNVGTSFVARVGPEDVETLQKIYEPEFSGYDLINSNKYTWYTKMIVDNSQEKPFTMQFEKPSDGNPELTNAIKELSRLKYGRDKAIVEAEIMERAAIGEISATAAPPTPTE